MSTKRKQTRYTEEEEILREIQKAKDSAVDRLKRAIECDGIADSRYKQIAELEPKWAKAAPSDARTKMWDDICALKHCAELKRTEAKRLSQKRNRLEQTRLPKLKDALAEFKTTLLSITDDPGVVLR